MNILQAMGRDIEPEEGDDRPRIIRIQRGAHPWNRPGFPHIIHHHHHHGHGGGNGGDEMS